MNYRYCIRNTHETRGRRFSAVILILSSRAVTDARKEDKVNSHRVIDPLDVFNRRGATYVLRFLACLTACLGVRLSSFLLWAVSFTRRSLGIEPGGRVSRLASDHLTGQPPHQTKSKIDHSTLLLTSFPSPFPPSPRLFSQHPACSGRRRSRPQPTATKVASKYRMVTANQNRR